MTGLAFAAAAALAFAGAFWFYTTRELPVPGREVFALLRGTALVLVLLLLWNPALPGRTAERGEAVLLVDRSPSMSAGTSDEPTPEARAAEVAAAFDGVVREIDAGLADAAARAVEAGATSVTVVTDLRSGDGVALRALAAEAAVPVEVLDVGRDVANAGISALEVPERARAGDRVSVSVRVHATDATPRTLLLLADGDTVDRSTIAPAEAGTERVVEITLEVPGTEASRVTVEAVLEGSDAHAPDDRRLGVLALDDPGGGIVAVSWAPDWELRTLVPLLDEVSGLDARGYLALADGRWLRASSDPGVVETEAVRTALRRAELVVLHDAPVADTGLAALARRVPRRLELSLPEDAPGLGPSQPGEWFVAADLPVSAIAAELAGLELLGLPPLTRVRTGSDAAGTPLALQRGGAGAPVAAFDLVAAEGERVVVARAEGFWRWAGRAGAGSELYRRLWSGLVAWLLTPDGTTRVSGFGPRASDAPAGTPVEVLVGEGERLEVVWTAAAGADTLRVDTLPAGSAPIRTLPGFETRAVVAWDARVLPSSDATDPDADALPSAAGALIVQPAGTEMRPARDIALPEDVAALSGSGGARTAAGSPLRDTPWPWIAIVLVLSAEWIGRRRSGLR